MFEYIADKIVYGWLGLNAGAHMSSALHFFIYDTLKILTLLVIVVFLMGIINAYFPVEKVRQYLTRKNLFGFEYFLASSFGAVTPFCSCSSVPLFIGFVKGGIPLGVTFAFLITSPLVNEVAIALFFGMFGAKVTAIYVASGILLGSVGGFVLGKFRLERFLSEWVQKIQQNTITDEKYFEEVKLNFRQRLPIITRDAWDIIRGVIPYVIIGIALGAVMHGYVPANFFEAYMGKDNIFAVPASVILAIPLYSGASGILPIVQVLVGKGIPLGTAIAFMMGVVGLSLPEAMLLKKVMTIRMIGIFFGTVGVFIVFSGYLFNWVL